MNTMYAASRDARVLVAGLVPMRERAQAAAEIVSETEKTLDLLEQRLAEAGRTLVDLPTSTLWLTDATDHPALNVACAGRFIGMATPIRSTVVSALIAPVKIQAVAWRRSDDHAAVDHDLLAGDVATAFADEKAHGGHHVGSLVGPAQGHAQ